MSLYGAFSSSVLGMLSQSQALNTIGSNIANVSTGGFKGSETRFSTLVGTPLFNESDLGGVRPNEFQRIDQQGLLQASESDNDLAISGNGFFVLSKTFAVDTDALLYGRDGSFQMKTLNDVAVTADDGSTITVKDGYLVDKNGYYVLGWEPGDDGTFPTSGGTLTPLRIDAYAFTDSFDPTTTANLTLNLPANGDANSTESYAVSLVDSDGESQAVTLKFYKSHVANQWIVVPNTDGTGGTQVDTVTLGGTPEVGDVYNVTVNNSAVSYTVQAGDTLSDVRDGLIAKLAANSAISGAATASASGTNAITLTSTANDTPFSTSTSAVNNGSTADNTASYTTTATVLTFGSDGYLTSPTDGSADLTMDFSGGATADVTFDMSELSQFDGSFLPINYSANGYASSRMASFHFDDKGRVIGIFEDSTYRALYKLPLATFSNPNGLEAKNGNVFVESENSGDPTIVASGTENAGSFQPNSRELSNVDIATEFTKMIITQQAYNSSATVFKTLDEITETTRDLKR